MEGIFSDFWRDIISIVATVVTIASLFYAIWQIRKTKSATEAASRATREALEQVRADYRRFSAGNARRFFAEAQLRLDRGEWQTGAQRLDDLAEIVANISADPSWSAFAEDVRRWSDKFKRRSGALSDALNDKWRSFCRRLQGAIDSLNTPFSMEPDDVDA